MQCIVDGCSGGHFYPRPPRGGRRVQRASSAHKHNFYPRPPRGGRPDHSSGHRHNDFISIHALREEGDRCNLSVVYSSTIFLSTPSARRATLQCIVDGCSGGHFYPRPPRGGRLEQPYKKCEACKISIHALREEGDQGNTAALSVTTIFLSTPSARRATGYNAYSGIAGFLFLSTPSARRATAPLSSSRSRLCNFYPRPPRGGRPTGR